jgi:hypothetical protein
MPDADGSFERRGGGIRGVQRAGFARELYLCAARSFSRKRERKGCLGSEILHLYIDLVENLWLLVALRPGEHDLAIGNAQHLHRKIERGLVGPRPGLSVRAACANGREIPRARSVFQQRNARLVDRDASYVQLSRHDKRRQVYTNGDRLRAEERTRAELRVVADGQVRRSYPTRQERQLQFAQLHRTAERFGQLGFEQWTELVGVHEERRHDCD